MGSYDLEIIANSLARTRMAMGIKGSAKAKEERAAAALRLLAIDLGAAIAHENPRFSPDCLRQMSGC